MLLNKGYLGCRVFFCLGLFVIQGCGYSGDDCTSHYSKYCDEGVAYWLDSCGKIEDVIDNCTCGCDDNQEECKKCCETNDDCPQDYWCDRMTWECREVDAGPCAGVNCDWHGTCVEWQGQALCDCESGYNTSADGLHCELAGYAISLTWSFSDAANCTAAQVAGVDVVLLQGGTELASATIYCSQSDGADIEELQDGTYKIELRANSTAGELTYYGEGFATVSGQDQNLNITMDPVGFLVFTWDIAGQTCTAAGVSNVSVKVDSEDGSTNLYTASPTPNCDEGGHSTEQTAFFFLGNYSLLLEGICASDLSTGYNYDPLMMVTEKGENNYGLLSLAAVGGGCP